MKKIVTFPIDGAVSMADLEIHGEEISLPKMNPAYKFCLVGTTVEGVQVLSSKDGKSYSLTLSVKIGNEEYDRSVLIDLYRSVYTENKHDEFLELLDSVLEIIAEWKKVHEESKGELSDE